MGIKPKCDKCGKDLTEFGGILFGPPDKNSKVKKNHLCKKCYNQLASSF